MNRLALPLLLGLGSPALAAAHVNLPTRPTDLEVSALEQQLLLPEGARPLPAYDRFYAAQQIDDQRSLLGMLIARPLLREPPPTSAPVAKVANAYTLDLEAFPATLPGHGCDALLVLADASEGALRISEVRCAGR